MLSPIVLWIHLKLQKCCLNPPFSLHGFIALDLCPDFNIHYEALQGEFWRVLLTLTVFFLPVHIRPKKYWQKV